MHTTTNLAEQYRPRDWSEVAGQDKAVAALQRLEKIGKLSGRAYWISGKSGHGKTTLARIIARKCADASAVYECDAATVTARMIQDWGFDQHMQPLTETPNSGRVYILNEAHGLRKDTIRALLVFLEELRPWTTVVFTTTNEGELLFEETQIDSSPLMSRCTFLALTSQGVAKEFAARIHAIMVAAGFAPLSMAELIKLAQRHKNNMRAMLNEIEVFAEPATELVTEFATA